jgi:hypothetical protein
MLQLIKYIENKFSSQIASIGVIYNNIFNIHNIKTINQINTTNLYKVFITIYIINYSPNIYYKIINNNKHKNFNNIIINIHGNKLLFQQNNYCTFIITNNNKQILYDSINIFQQFNLLENIKKITL